MTPEQMQKIVDYAPGGWQWVLISNQGKAVYFKDCSFGLAYYMGKTCWICANPDVKKHLVDKEGIQLSLCQHDTLDLEPADIPHGCIVLEK